MKKDKFTFGNIFSKSVREYTGNFKEIFKFIFLFIGIPYLLLTLIQIIFLIADPNLFSMVSTPTLLAEMNTGTLKFPLYYSITSYFFSMISMFLTLLVSAGLISTSLKKSRFSLSELISNAKSRYWKFFAFSIVVGIFILLLTLLLIIPGIIFAIYWTFAAFIFFDKKEKIMPSLKQSKAIVRHRWWKTFGYLLLFGLILGGFMLVTAVINLPTFVIMMIQIAQGSQLSLGLLIVSSLLSLIYSFIVSLIAAPLSVLFLKNFYMEMKK